MNATIPTIKNMSKYKKNKNLRSVPLGTKSW
jgi:hypothetical protein